MSGFSRTPAQAGAPVTLEALIGNLSSLDYSTRNNAARLIRRTPQAEAVPALTEAVRKNPDEFVRYRALVLLTAFGDRGTRDLMVSLLRDRNDRVREVAYKWLERNPDPRLTDTLLTALQSEQAEFVRPALVGALAALDDSAQVQRALLVESMRGLDFFREAVIEALGRQRAEYAVDTIAGIAKLDGPLRQASILALGRIGGTRARAVLTALAADPGDALPILRAAQCLAGESCDAHIKALSGAAVDARNAGAVRASIAALAAIATGGGTAPPVVNGPAPARAAAPADAVPGFTRSSVAAAESLIALASRDGLARDQAGLEFSTVALRRPDAMVAWLDGLPDASRTSAIALLKDGFERLEEEFAEEQFYASARAAYWKAPEGSSTRELSAAIIQRLEF
jgi:HEAT repeat protein